MPAFSVGCSARCADQKRSRVRPGATGGAETAATLPPAAPTAATALATASLHPSMLSRKYVSTRNSAREKSGRYGQRLASVVEYSSGMLEFTCAGATGGAANARTGLPVIDLAGCASAAIAAALGQKSSGDRTRHVSPSLTQCGASAALSAVCRRCAPRSVCVCSTPYGEPPPARTASVETTSCATCTRGASGGVGRSTTWRLGVSSHTMCRSCTGYAGSSRQNDGLVPAMSASDARNASQILCGVCAPLTHACGPWTTCRSTHSGAGVASAVPDVISRYITSAG